MNRNRHHPPVISRCGPLPRSRPRSATESMTEHEMDPPPAGGIDRALAASSLPRRAICPGLVTRSWPRFMAVVAHTAQLETRARNHAPQAHEWTRLRRRSPGTPSSRSEGLLLARPAPTAIPCPRELLKSPFARHRTPGLLSPGGIPSPVSTSKRVLAQNQIWLAQAARSIQMQEGCQPGQITP
jgi:hypothetical protein